MLDLFLEKFAKSADSSLHRVIVENILEPLSVELDITLDDVEGLEEEKGNDGTDELELVVLPVNYKRIAETLFKYASQKKSENREEIYGWKQKFEQFDAERKGVSGSDVLDQQEKELAELQENKKSEKQNKKETKKDKKNETKKKTEKSKKDKKKQEEEVIDIITPSAEVCSCFIFDSHNEAVTKWRNI
jgi:vacuolar-type H+-ATPase subunit I/STV1